MRESHGTIFQSSPLGDVLCDGKRTSDAALAIPENTDAQRDGQVGAILAAVKTFPPPLALANYAGSDLSGESQRIIR